MVEEVPNPEHLLGREAVVGAFDLDNAGGASGGVPENQVREAASREPGGGYKGMIRVRERGWTNLPGERGVYCLISYLRIRVC